MSFLQKKAQMTLNCMFIKVNEFCYRSKQPRKLDFKRGACRTQKNTKTLQKIAKVHQEENS